MLEFYEIVGLLTRLILGAVGSFFAVLLWSKTRDLAWILIVIGTLVSYVDIVYTTLERFGIVEDSLLFFSGIPFFKIVLTNIPIVFFIIAFIVVITRRRYRS